MSTLEHLEGATPPGPVAGHEPDQGEQEGARLPACFHLVGRVEDQLRFADSKAAFLATIHTLLVGPLVYNVVMLRTALHQWDLASRAVLLGLGGAYGLLFLASMSLVALTVLPRFSTTKRAASRAFFGQIAREFGHDPRRFVAHLATMTERDWLDELGVYVVDAAQIASAKHRHVRYATVLTAASVVVWCAVVLAMLGLN
jgi:hypothetical protein